MEKTVQPTGHPVQVAHLNVTSPRKTLGTNRRFASIQNVPHTPEAAKTFAAGTTTAATKAPPGGPL